MSTRHEDGYSLQSIWTLRWSQIFLSGPRIAPQLITFPASSLNYYTNWAIHKNIHGSSFIRSHLLQARGRVTAGNTLIITQPISREEFLQLLWHNKYNRSLNNKTSAKRGFSSGISMDHGVALSCVILMEHSLRPLTTNSLSLPNVWDRKGRRRRLSDKQSEEKRREIMGWGNTCHW